MASGTPWINSPGCIRKISPTTGTKLCRYLSRLVLLSLGCPEAHQVWLLCKAMRRLMLLSPLLHLHHLVLLSLSLLSMGRPRAHQVRLLGKPMLRLMLLSPLLHLRHLVLLSLGLLNLVLLSLGLLGLVLLSLGRTRRSSEYFLPARKQRLRPVGNSSL